MEHLLGDRGGGDGLDRERARRLVELVEDRAARGLEPTALGGREPVLGQREAAQVVEGGAGTREPLVEPGGERTE